jgi:CheY-like chemotaxis protein
MARGYAVATARDGTEAFVLARTRRLRPAVILLDLKLPGMDGVEFLERQDEEPAFAGVPVIVLSGHPEQLRMLTPTVRAVLEKPLDGSKILRLVEDLCRTPD